MVRGDGLEFEVEGEFLHSLSKRGEDRDDVDVDGRGSVLESRVSGLGTDGRLELGGFGEGG